MRSPIKLLYYYIINIKKLILKKLPEASTTEGFIVPTVILQNSFNSVILNGS